jgi:hypothetical protein
VVDVQEQRSNEVSWRFISLAVLNEQQTADWYTPEYRRGHLAGLECLRVADAVRLAEGNDAVGRLYTAYGTGIHVEQQRDAVRAETPAFIGASLERAGLDRSFAGHWEDTSHDEYIRAETALALERTGKDVGTPIITFRPGTERENSFFGPVISKAPKGDEAVRLWDAIELIATTSGMAELKRSLRSKPVFD